ncbi:MAG: helix-turn-helix domain-containing protein [Treponema sp.]|jgi:transcriptional regulator with XRE-family HTH domain|nr:helix-turn-helix domain-containing protein [Treponema sp.]
MIVSEGTILDRIRAIRKTLGINQSEFAKRIGLTQTSMSMIEIGKSNLTEKNIKMICTTFNVHEKWLRTGSGDMFGSPSPYEKELVDILGQLTDDTQEFLLDMARNLLKRQEKSQALAAAEENPSPGEDKTLPSAR